MAHNNRTASEAQSDSSSSSDDNVTIEENPNVTLGDLKVGGKISLPRISLEAYILGFMLGFGVAISPYLITLYQSPLWRTAFFLSTLSIFHFLEFYTYARWNIKNAKADSYLTLSNGRPYIIAMTFALVETTTTSIFFPKWQARWSPIWIQVIGLVLLAGGQWMRHSAIATAGSSFNHIVQRQKRSDHVLVTWGPYAWCRHPSYFGFYWWAVGSQVVIGNAISTILFALIVWRFFWRRIPSKSQLLQSTSPITTVTDSVSESMSLKSRQANRRRREMIWAC